MAWYEDYRNKIGRNEGFYVIVDDQIYPKYSKVIEPRSGGLRWFEYYKKDGEMIRYYKKDYLRIIHFNEAKEKYPDYFVDLIFGV